MSITEIINTIFGRGSNNIDNTNNTPEKKSKTDSVFYEETAPVNGQIDETFFQGNVGDCALLSSLYALSLTDNGKQAISNSIKLNKNSSGQTNSYDVYFEGVDETYNITQKELDDAKRFNGDYKNERVYSHGDDDVTLLELAAEKCFEESDNSELRFLVDNYTTLNEQDKLQGVNPAAVTYLFTKEATENIIKGDIELKTRFVPCMDYSINDVNNNQVNFKEGGEYRARTKRGNELLIDDVINNVKLVIPYNEFYQKVYEKNNEEARIKSEKLLKDLEQNKGNKIVVFATSKNENVIDVNGNVIKLSGPHAYCISEVKDGVVTLINPGNTSEEIKIKQSRLLNLDKYFMYGLDLN